MADISVSLVLDDRGFVRSVTQAQTQVTNLGNQVDKEASQMSNAFASLKGAIAGIGITSLVAQLALLSSETVNTARGLGTSTAAVKAWQMSLGAAGGDMDNARDALIDLTQKMNEALTSGGDLATAFNKVGLSLTDLQTISQEDMMRKVIEGLAGIKDGAERSRIALVLMGEDAKNVDWAQVANDYDKISESAKKIAPSLEEARKAQQEFNKQYQNFSDQLTAAIPWESLTSGLKTIGDNISNIMETAKSIGMLVAALSGLKVIGPLVESFGKFAISLGAARTAGESLFSVFKSSAGIGTGLTTITETVGGLHKGLLTTFSSWEKFGILLRGVTLGFVQMLPFIGQVATGFVILNEATRLLTGNSLVQWADSGIESIQNLGEEAAKYAGIIDKTSREERAYRENVKKIAIKQAEEEAAADKQKTEAAAKAAEAKAKEEEAGKRAFTLLQNQKKTLSDLMTDLKASNETKLKQIQLDTDLIGKSEIQKRISQELAAIEADRASKVNDLTQKLSEVTDPQLQQSYKDSIAQVNAEYEKQKTLISDSIVSQEKRLATNRLEVFSSEKLRESMDRIKAIQDETANLTLPLIEQKWAAIEQAATKAIDAQIEAEKSARGLQPNQQLPAEDVAKITASVRARVEAEKEAIAVQEKAIELDKLRKFGIEELQSANQQVAEIYNELGNSLLPEIERKENEILQAAQARARAEIQAEEARRGSAMSAEERAQYESIAAREAQKVADATKKSYEESRTFSYGWKKAFQEYQDNAGNAAKTAESLFKKAVGGMEDALVGFAKTGKFEWKSFMSSMLEDLLRSQIQNVFSGMMGSMTNSVRSINTGGGNYSNNTSNSGGGGFWSSIGNGISSLFSGFFATGGMIPPGRFGIVGENGPEYVQGPANVTPASQMGTYVTYNINAVDAMSFKQMIASDPQFLYGVTMQGAKSIPGRR